MFGKSKNSKGFTLVELLIAMAVFGLLIGSMSNAAIAIIKAQRRIFAVQKAQESIRYILETVTKEIRMSTVNTTAGGPLSTLNITNPNSETFDFAFSGSNFLRDGQLMNPMNADITGAFYVRNTASADQAVVTIVMKVSVTGGKTESSAEISAQSTVTNRP